jgi:hypothetical protein
MALTGSYIEGYIINQKLTTLLISFDYPDHNRAISFVYLRSLRIVSRNRSGLLARPLLLNRALGRGSQPKHPIDLKQQLLDPG